VQLSNPTVLGGWWWCSLWGFHSLTDASVLGPDWWFCSLNLQHLDVGSFERHLASHQVLLHFPVINSANECIGCVSWCSVWISQWKPSESSALWLLLIPLETIQLGPKFS
jgi:hypothetical protein